jgi:hypothetical protein
MTTLALFFATKGDVLAWVELEPPGGEYIGFRSHVGALRPLPEGVEYLITMHDEPLFPWLKRIRVDRLASVIWPGISHQLRTYGVPRVDAQNQALMTRGLFKRIVAERHLANLGEVWALQGELLPQLASA